MDEMIYQIAEQIAQLHQKAYEIYLSLIDNRVQFEAVKNEAGLNRFVMTSTKWLQ